MGNKYKWVESSTMSVDNTTPIYGVQFEKVDYNDAYFMTTDGDFNLSIYVSGDILTVNVTTISTFYNNSWDITYSEGGTEDINANLDTFHVVMENNKYTIDFPAELVLMEEPSGDKSAVWYKVIDDSPSTEPEEPEVPEKYKWVESSTMSMDITTPIYGVQLENVDTNDAYFSDIDYSAALYFMVKGGAIQIALDIDLRTITYSEGSAENIVFGLGKTFTVVMENNKYTIDFPVELVAEGLPSNPSAVWYKVIDDSPSTEPEEPEVPNIPISQNLNRIIQAKADIKTAIENKGVTVGDITIDGYAEKINEITVGGSELIKLPSTITFNGGTVSGDFDMGQWDWSPVKDWSEMFYEQSNLTSLINFPTYIKPVNMQYMFYNCRNLTSLDVSKWDTSNVLSMAYMFYECNNLTSLDVSKWDTSNVLSMAYMFTDCNNLISLDGIENWDTSKVTKMSSMFHTCEKLTSLDVSNWDTSKVTEMDHMFRYCYNLTSLDVSNWDTSKVTEMGHMFYGCYNLTSLDVSNWDTSKVTEMEWMFHTCEKLTSLDVSNWDTSNVTTMNQMFRYCYNLTEVKMGGDVSKVTNVSDMFGGIRTTGTFYYNPQYDYSKIIAQLPSTWTAVPME